MQLNLIRPIFKRIGLKLILLVGLTAVIIFGIYAFLNIHTQENVLIREVERHGNQLSETIKKSMRHGMLQYSQQNINEIILTITEDPSIYEVRIMNKEGKIIYSSTKSEVNRMVDKNAESCYACHAEDKPLTRLPIPQRTRIYFLPSEDMRLLGIINPIHNETSCWMADCHAHTSDQTVLGVLDVTMCLNEVDMQISKNKMMLAMFAITAILAFSILIGIFVHRWVARPVNYLLKATNQVASGNLNYTIEDLGDDELGMLAKSFNNMTLKMAEARKQLFQSDKMASLGRLAAGVAHEINNPLTGILTYSSFLQKRVKSTPEIQEDLKVIVRETLRSREIVKGLLDFARQSIPRKRKANLNDIIERAIKVVSNQLKMKQIMIQTSFDERMPDVMVDSNQIQQVFINLFVNAGDAMNSHGGKILITTSTLNLAPYGNQQIKEASCPKNHSLMDDKIKIGGLPSIKVKTTVDNQQEFIYIDPVYGKHRTQYGQAVADASGIQISCPECDVSLMHESLLCPRCGSPAYELIIPSKGTLEGCLSATCNWQTWAYIDSIGLAQYVQATIEDEGCGIEESELDKIFEPFYTTKGQKGSGLGLSIIWGIIDNHDGHIQVKSTVGKGTVFTLRLPA